MYPAWNVNAIIAANAASPSTLLSRPADSLSLSARIARTLCPNACRSITPVPDDDKAELLLSLRVLHRERCDAPRANTACIKKSYFPPSSSIPNTGGGEPPFPITITVTISLSSSSPSPLLLSPTPIVTTRLLPEPAPKCLFAGHAHSQTSPILRHPSHSGLRSEHLTRRLLHPMHPFRDLVCPFLGPPPPRRCFTGSSFSLAVVDR
ncbi:hypothetical protein GQ607_011046 [Colletotrichum asianum]|uniref:Uncharacterized protein n=1 Tax=Colletotrichum asianum TaxID=702518 RepID=A0A8H3ZS73_9PEZI|nr:hypothetical protein GQ607_011046 [Colletotrichum asianum]